MSWRPFLFSILVAASRIPRAIELAILHAAAGLLQRKHIHQSTAGFWEEFATSRTEADEAGLMPWETALYSRHLKPGERVLLVGCGTGRDLRGLLGLGMRADGQELSPKCALLARANTQRLGFPAEVFEGPIETFMPPAPYDAYVFSWFCYSYIPEALKRIEVLQRFRKRLNAKGRILVTNPGPAPRRRRLLLRFARFVSILMRSDWRPEQGDILELSPGNRHLRFEHAFKPGELEREAETAGFSVQDRFDADGVQALILTPANTSESIQTGR